MGSERCSSFHSVPGQCPGRSILAETPHFVCAGHSSEILNKKGMNTMTGIRCRGNRSFRTNY